MEKVLYFAACRERTGIAEERLALAGLSVAEVKARLLERYSGLADVLPHCRVAVDERFTKDDETIPEGAELALIPPVAGG